jgi:putative heme-binding domain-containing protein
MMKIGRGFFTRFKHVTTTGSRAETARPGSALKPALAGTGRLPSILVTLGLAVCSSLVLAPTSRAGDVADPATQLEALPGFKVELVFKADPAKNGSFISLGRDSKGRLLLGGQRGQPLTRLTIKDGKVEKEEILKLPISEIMGQLEVGDNLYVDGSDGKKFGLFRLHSSSKADDNYDQVELLREWKSGAGEHGAHAIVLGPDKKLYIVCGNFTGLPDDLLPSSPHRNYADDLALPRAEDGNGFGAGKKPPGGFICRMDLDGKNPELFASGDRNTYDIAFNADGELIGFDSDMEWDWGTPWYRPIRVYHAASGADQGFREGTGKWPEYYADSLPAVVDVGLGCPTGVVFGYGTKFPAKYQKAYYALDWTYGRLIAVHLKPKGSTYEATWENFVAPKALHSDSGKVPLNLTDVIVGEDGALYFTIGGRGTQAALYRVVYTGAESTAPVDPHDSEGAEARALRHQLEAFHGKQDPKAVEFAWPQLSSEDRFIRYAARLAIESQPVAEWKSKALAETKPEGAFTALLALARMGGAESQADLLASLGKFPAASLDKTQLLDKLRVLEVSISRQGKPSAELAKPFVTELEALYPAKDIEVNRELCQVLLVLDPQNSVAKTVALLKAAPTQEEQITYILALRTITTGWTPELRKEYFSWWSKDHAKAEHPDYVLKWFEDAGRPYGDGSSYAHFVSNLRADAIKTLTPEEEASLQPILALYTPPGARPKKPQKARALVKAWTMEDLEPDLAKVGSGRNFKVGKAVFEEAQCLNCHKFGNEGGAVGPDLTAVSSRFARKDVLESIILPSKVISEQYAATTIRTKDGDVVEGRVVEETNDKVVVQPNQLLPEKITVKKTDVKSRGLSKVSPMPEGLVNTFHKEEILDMLAYIESGGRKDHPDFAKK